MKELIEFISRALVDNPDQVVVTQKNMNGKINLELQVAKEDMGRVIGKNGRIANAIRTLLRVSAAQEGKRATLDIVEPE